VFGSVFSDVDHWPIMSSVPMNFWGRRPNLATLLIPANNDPNNGTPAQPQQPDVYDKCNAEGKAAAAQEPSMLPNQSSLLSGVMGYIVTLARTGSQKAGWQGFLIGNLLRPAANAYLQSAAYTNTRQACLAANGAGSLTFTMAP
jgi:hypothetical protein